MFTTLGVARIAIGVIVAVLAIILVIAGVGFALAHGEFDWIQANFPGCCGRADCAFVEARPAAGGWLVEWRGRTLPYIGREYPSPSGLIACGTADQVRCLFVPGRTT